MKEGRGVLCRVQAVGWKGLGEVQFSIGEGSSIEVISGTGQFYGEVASAKSISIIVRNDVGIAGVLEPHRRILIRSSQRQSGDKILHRVIEREFGAGSRGANHFQRITGAEVGDGRNEHIFGNGRTTQSRADVKRIVSSTAGERTALSGSDDRVVASAGVHSSLGICRNGENIIAGTRVHVDSRDMQHAEGQIAGGGGTVDGGQLSEVINLERKRGIPRDVEGFDLYGTSKSKAAVGAGSVHGNGRGLRILNNGLLFAPISGIPGPIDIDGQGMIGLVIGDDSHPPSHP